MMPARSVLKLASDNPAPHLSPRALDRWPWGNALMSPEQHRRQAALLRASSSTKAHELAEQHDMLARAIERRAGA
jgi:hypothetical protein